MTAMSGGVRQDASMITVMQLSDTHFGLPGNRSHGGFGYDTDVAFERVCEHAFRDGAHPDLIVITGDIADHGLEAEYKRANAALARLPVAANLCPGNHDFAEPFAAGLTASGLTRDRSVRRGNWLFLFVDSNFDGRAIVDDVVVDRPNRIEAIGGIGPQETAAIDAAIAADAAAHVFIWLHHPPAMSGSFFNPDYDAEVAAIVARHPQIRGIAGGHVHTDAISSLAGLPVFVCPALTVNFDITANTLLPPGYRTYEFHGDGRVTSDCHLIDDEAWPRRKLPSPVIAHLKGELSWEELTEIMNRPRA